MIFPLIFLDFPPDFSVSIYILPSIYLEITVFLFNGLLILLLITLIFRLDFVNPQSLHRLPCNSLSIYLSIPL